MTEQRINFTRSRDGWRLGWSAMGNGPPVLYLLQKHHLTRSMDEPRYARSIRRAAERHTVLRFDFRGTGLSQRGIDTLSQSLMCEDIEAVLDAAGFERVSIVATNNTCLWAVPFAVAHPERVSRLVLSSPMARWEVSPALRETLARLCERDWFGYWETVVALQLDLGPDEVKLAARICADACDPADYFVLRDSWDASPIDDLLPQCSTPTLVVRPGGRVLHAGTDSALEVAALLPNAQMLSTDRPALTTDVEWLTSEPIFDFLADSAPRISPNAAAGLLSPRERDVVALVALGRTDAEIATALGIAPRTASRHVHNILEKLNMSRRSEAAAWWARATATSPRD